ncbi:MAG: acyltransferase family protein [Bacteroidales bacterium]|nr:acyltransferase family protein [Bacteroidales bacterium]
MDEIITKDERIYYLDTAKVIAVFLVVFAHLFSTYSLERIFIYSFHMPFFFLVSGLFHKWKGKVQWKKYLNMLFVNVLLANVLYVIIGGVIYHSGL